MLYPTFTAPAVREDNKKQGGDYRQSVSFDFETGDLQLDSAGRVVTAGGVDAWLQWCRKVLASERGELLAYSQRYGVELEYARTRAGRAAQEAAIVKTIKEALMADPARRTADVRDFKFAWDGDGVEVRFAVWGADGYTGEMSAYVKGG